MSNPMLAKILERLEKDLPTLNSVWVFGSRASHTAGPESDWDFAVLTVNQISPSVLAASQEALPAELAVNGVDLVDLRQAPLTLSMEVLRNGKIVFDKDPVFRQHWEVILMSRYVQLNFERREILQDIQIRGRIHGG